MSETRPRILFLSPFLPFPANSGVKIRIWNVLRAVAAVGDVYLLCYTGEEKYIPERDGWKVKALEALCEHVEVLDQPGWWPHVNDKDLRQVVEQYVVRSGPFIFREYGYRPLVDRARQLADEFDLVWIERLMIAYHLKAIGGKSIVDVDDLESIKLSRALNLEHDYWIRMSRSFDVWKTSREEKRSSSIYRHVIVCSYKDAHVLRGRRPIWVVPNGVADEYFELPLKLPTENRIVFVGVLDYPPNEDAVEFLCHHVLPRVRARVPDASFWVVGKNPSARVRDLTDGHAVQLFADVPDVVEYVQAAKVSVVPLRVGGGTRLKILESMALGTPVVATTIGAEGLKLVHGEDFLCADSADEFADGVCRLLLVPGERQRLVNTARVTAGTLYRWSAIRASLTTVLRGIARDVMQSKRTAG